MALIDDFKSRFPVLSHAEIDAMWANLELSWPCHYNFGYGVNSCTDEAIMQLIAHLFTLGSLTSDSAVRETASKSVGSVSESYVALTTVSERSSFFRSTRYGQQFLLLTSHRHGAFFV